MDYREYRLQPATLILLTVVLSVLLTVAYLAFSADTVLGVLTKVGIFTTCIGVFWSVTDRYLWRIGLLRRFLFNNIPDLNGRWEGTVDRDGEERPHAFVTEIRQTLTRITMHSHSSSGGSRNVITRLGVDGSGEKFGLICTWVCETATPLDGERSGLFLGTSVLDCLPDGRLVGRYFTDRRPMQTRGATTVTFASRQLRDAFQ